MLNSRKDQATTYSLILIVAMYLRFIPRMPMEMIRDSVQYNHFGNQSF